MMQLMFTDYCMWRKQYLINEYESDDVVAAIDDMDGKRYAWVGVDDLVTEGISEHIVGFRRNFNGCNNFKGGLIWRVRGCFTLE
ncbi:hypothetical protein TNCV_2473461 [Trichonephila clavipes]|nr:hypothetical protein TNCV_2473461 [Trichonephila clavipes]